ncbi:MAG TPA: sigma-70 family RNA polymerase sigma factor [Solirubrobacteraceae bacterium]
MGETATALGLRQPADRASVVGQSDDELIAGVRGGDTAAFEEIYDRYARGILAFCAHMLGSREAAEDALQLTFVSAYRALCSGQNSIALRPWLYTIARNRCLSELRARRDAIGVDELTSDHPVFEGLADQVQRREDLREMLDDMQRLPADQRAALVLFELGDHPQKDIASVLGVRTEKVKALVFQAREALVRGRQARQHPCGDIREQLATMEGRIPARSLLRAHIDRCAGCQSFEHEVRHQRAALAVILPVALAGELKSSILGSALHSGAVAAACGGGGGAVAASACGGSAVVGGATTVGGVSAIGGATAVSGVGGGLGAVSAATAGGLASAGAVATSAPVVAAATGLTAIGESIGVGGLSATGVVAKILTAAAIATVAASTGHSDRPFAHRATAPPTTRERLLASVPARSAPRAPAPFEHPPATTLPAPGTVSSTTLGGPEGPASTTPTTSGGATSTQTASPGSAAAGGSTAPATAGGTGSTTPPATTDPSASTTPSGTSSPTTTGSATTAPTSTPVSDPTGSATSTAPAASAPADTAAADPSSTSTDSASAPAGSTDAASSTGSAPSAPATDSSAAGSAAADTGSSSSGTAGDSAAAAAPSTSAVDQSSSSPSAAAGSAAQANVSQAAAAPAQTDATVAPG